MNGRIQKMPFSDAMQLIKMRATNKSLADKLIESRVEVVELNKKIMLIYDEYQKISNALTSIQNSLQTREQQSCEHHREVMKYLKRKPVIGGF